MIIVQEEVLLERVKLIEASGFVDFDLGTVDDGDVLSEFSRAASMIVACILAMADEKEPASYFERSDLGALLLLSPVKDGYSSPRTCLKVQGKEFEIFGFRRKGQSIEEDEVILVPLERDLFSRVKGLFETDVLADKKVLVIGVGSGGSPIALELAKSGVQRFMLVDPDRLEIGNVARHASGLSDLGRFKTLAVKDLILEKNPFARVETLEAKAEWPRQEVLERLVSEADLVICATDNRESKMLVNRICINKGRICLFGGAFRRAYGGQILRVRPRESVCYQCFLEILPQVAADQEISNHQQASEIQYSPDDSQVAIEPGLSIDIAPISIMMAKIALLELLRDRVTTLDSLYEDLIADWYLWINRRERGTDYEHLKPLGYEIGEMSILRWYGVLLKRNPGCSVCGEFLKDIAAELRPEDLEFFKDAEKG